MIRYVCRHQGLLLSTLLLMMVMIVVVTTVFDDDEEHSDIIPFMHDDVYQHSDDRYEGGRLGRHGHNSTMHQCRHTLDGRILTVDNNGRLCRYASLNARTRCCPMGKSTRAIAIASSVVCKNCDRRMCCSSYESCVACCVHIMSATNNETVVASIASAMAPFRLLLNADDPFDLCVAKCRTNSASVLHENRYINPDATYCYGVHAPQASK